MRPMRLVVSIPVLLIGLVASIAILISGFSRAGDANNLLRNGKQVVGTVSDSISAYKRQAKVHYRFDVNGNTYEGESPVNKSMASSAYAGMQIPVTYLPSDPNTNSCAPNFALVSAQRSEMFGGCVLVVVLILGAAIIFFGNRAFQVNPF